MINNELIEGATDTLKYDLLNGIKGSRFKIMYDKGSKICVMNGWITTTNAISKGNGLIGLSINNKQPNPYYFTMADADQNIIGIAELGSNGDAIVTDVSLNANANYIISGSFVLN